MRLRSLLTALCVTFLLTIPVRAQDAGIMGSAETINPGNFKLAAYPMLVLGSGSNELGIGARVGYGLRPSWDIEGFISFFDGLTIFGAEVEYWILRGQSFHVSVAGGVHYATGDFADGLGIDARALISAEIFPRIELYGGLDAAFEFPGDPFDSYSTWHIVPGIEYSLAPNIDIIAEFGLGLNGHSADYIAGGIAYYIR
jgi:hypothetical protein